MLVGWQTATNGACNAAQIPASLFRRTLQECCEQCALLHGVVSNMLVSADTVTTHLGIISWTFLPTGCGTHGAAPALILYCCVCMMTASLQHHAQPACCRDAERCNDTSAVCALQISRLVQRLRQPSRRVPPSSQGSLEYVPNLSCSCLLLLGTVLYMCATCTMQERQSTAFIHGHLNMVLWCRVVCMERRSASSLMVHP